MRVAGISHYFEDTKIYSDLLKHVVGRFVELMVDVKDMRIVAIDCKV